MTKGSRFHHELVRQELNYLKGKRKIQGSEAFITYIDAPVERGKVAMQLYDIFPGIQLMVSEFTANSCFQENSRQDVIGINHCSRGRFECEFDSRNWLYIGEGDIVITSLVRPPIASFFPLNYYYGSTIVLFPEICENVPELGLFGISAKRIFDKFALDRKSPVFRRDEAVEQIYNEIYSHLRQPELPFLRIKILELLYYFQNRQSAFEEELEYIPKSLTKKIKYVREHMIEDLEHRISIKELATEHDLSMTRLKSAFKQIYGESPYSYLRRYKMHMAAKMLQQTEDKISEIALELGYHNPSKFAEAFSSVMGCMPGKYREQYHGAVQNRKHNEG